MALVVRSKIKATVKGMRFSGDFFDALDKKVTEIVKSSVERAKGNKRATLRPHDL